MTVRALLAAVAAVFLLPASALAADREFTLAAEGERATWTSPVKFGAVYTSDVSSRVPACSPIFSCDSTLIRTEQYGDLVVDVVGKDQQGLDTMRDIDLHVYVSNENGDQGELLGEGITANPEESVTVFDAPAGYYLVYVDWYLGYGDYDGAATLTAPTTPLEPGQAPPEFVPAPEQSAVAAAPAPGAEVQP